jgi:hypothetical protein
MKARKIPIDCIFEAAGALSSDDVAEDPVVGESSKTNDEVFEGNSVHRWSIDSALALQDLRRALKIDAQPPPLQPLQTCTSSLSRDGDQMRRHLQRYGGLDLQMPTDGMHRDASQLLYDAERLLRSWNVTSSSGTDFAKTVNDLHKKVSLLKPGYAAELCDRIDATLKEAAKWQQGKTELCKELSINDDQLKETVQLIQFLNTEVSPSAAVILDASRRVQTLAPLYQAVSDRLAFLGIVVGATDSTSAQQRKLSEITASLSDLNAAMSESIEACSESVAALKLRITQLGSKRASLR